MKENLPVSAELPDTEEGLNRKDTENKLPLWWVLLFIALIAWGIYYYIAYTPSISGWTQERAFEKTMNME